MLVALLMGFSSGLPLLLTSRTLQAWASYTGGSNVLVGALALLGLPYTFKFIWAPLVDRYNIFPGLGRRRGWLLVTQLGIVASILFLSRLNPTDDLYWLTICAFAVSFFSASQDIVVDAYRRESLKDIELGLGSSMYQMGYRIAMWVAGALALILSSVVSWNTVYVLMSLFMSIGVLTSLWATEPEESSSAPKTLREAVVEPMREFFSRKGISSAVFLLVFVLLFKIGDAMAGNMLIKLYKDLSIPPEDVGLYAKSMAPFSVIGGTIIGGILIMRLSIYKSLFVFGVLQALSTLSFAVLHHFGYSVPLFAGVVFFEDFTGGMGSAAFMAFMSTLTNRSFTATQYALLTSLSAVPRTVISSGMGFVVDAIGWKGFFIFCTLAAVPGLILLIFISQRQKAERSPT